MRAYWRPCLPRGGGCPLFLLKPFSVGGLGGMLSAFFLEALFGEGGGDGVGFACLLRDALFGEGGRGGGVVKI